MDSYAEQVTARHEPTFWSGRVLQRNLAKILICPRTVFVYVTVTFIHYNYILRAVVQNG